MNGSVEGKRVLITQCEEFMGPACTDIFRQQGAAVVADNNDLRSSDACRAVIEAAGKVDVLVVNLASPNHYGTAVTDVEDEEWHSVFDLLVHPLHWLVRAVLPQMIERQRGKVVVFGSATPLRPMGRLCAYSAARGAQISYVKSAGVEVARHNVQINLIAQNWVENPSYYPPEMQANPKFQENLKRQVPLGRLAKPEEDIALALFLAGGDSDFFVGQAIPFSGGWAA